LYAELKTVISPEVTGVTGSVRALAVSPSTVHLIRNVLNNKLLRSQYNEVVQRKSVAV